MITVQNREVIYENFFLGRILRSATKVFSGMPVSGRTVKATWTRTDIFIATNDATGPFLHTISCQKIPFQIGQRLMLCILSIDFYDVKLNA